jgi:hypothetical protein
MNDVYADASCSPDQITGWVPDGCAVPKYGLEYPKDARNACPGSGPTVRQLSPVHLTNNWARTGPGGSCAPFGPPTAGTYATAPAAPLSLFVEGTVQVDP